MVKNMLPKSPLAAAGLGLLLGAGIGGLKGWLDVKKGDATQKEAVANAIKQGLLFGGVAAASTFAGGNKGGGAGLATMAMVGLSGGGGATVPAMLSSLSGSGSGRMGGGRGGMVGGQGQRRDGQASNSALETVSNAVSEVLVSAVTNKKKTPNNSTSTRIASDGESTNNTSDGDVEPSLTPSVST